MNYERFHVWRTWRAVRVGLCEGESYSIYLGAMHELPCQAYVLHTAGAQQGLNKNLQQSGNKMRYYAERIVLQTAKIRCIVQYLNSKSKFLEVETVSYVRIMHQGDIIGANSKYRDIII